MRDPVDIVDLVRTVSQRERGRGCIVMTHQVQGQKEWAAKLGEKSNAQHIDLLDVLDGNTAQAAELVRYTPEHLFDFLTEQAEKEVLIVSGIEFLKATWSGMGDAAQRFAALVESRQPRSKPALVFVMAFDKAIAEYPFRRFRQHTFVVDQRETLAL